MRNDILDILYAIYAEDYSALNDDNLKRLIGQITMRDAEGLMCDEFDALLEFYRS